MIAGPPRGFRHNALEAEHLQVEFIDESLDDADRIIVRDIVFQAIGKQRCLAAILAFDKTLHSGPRKSLAKVYLIQAFSHSLGRNLKFKIIEQISVYVEEPDGEDLRTNVCQNLCPYHTYQVISLPLCRYFLPINS